MPKKLTNLRDATTVDPLLDEIRQIIEQTRSAVAASVNSGLTLLNWRIGKRIGEEVLEGQRAEYGNQILATLSQQLSWSHFLAIIPLKDPVQREFYAEMCRIERWSVRTLRKKIDSMLFERTGISRKPDCRCLRRRRRRRGDGSRLCSSALC